MDKLDKNNAVEVNCVRDEYIYISQQPCENCKSKNAYVLHIQRLVETEDRTYDLLETKCQYCGHKKYFTFDITRYFEDLGKQFSNTLKHQDKYEDLDWDNET
jgi:DNA-directed RNA polymerase subunit RPC12/RpoP